MGAPIGPGDWVECIRGASHDGWPIARGDEPAIGRIYCVDAIVSAVARSGVTFPAIRLVSPRAWSARGREIAWAIDRFRPIYRPKSELIETLKTPVSIPGDVEHA